MECLNTREQSRCLTWSPRATLAVSSPDILRACMKWSDRILGLGSARWDAQGQLMLSQILNGNAQKSTISVCGQVAHPCCTERGSAIRTMLCSVTAGAVRRLPPPQSCCSRTRQGWGKCAHSLHSERLLSVFFFIIIIIYIVFLPTCEAVIHTEDPRDTQEDKCLFQGTEFLWPLFTFIKVEIPCFVKLQQFIGSFWGSLLYTVMYFIPVKREVTICF